MMLSQSLFYNLRKFSRYCWIFLIFLTLVFRQVKAQDPVSFVNPNIGGVGIILEPTRPTVQLPNQMVRSYPGRKDDFDDQITTFPLSLISHRLGHLFGIMPFTQEPESGRNPVSTWNRANEILTPFYYSEWLEEEDIVVEFTPGAKTGFFRLKFAPGGKKGLELQLKNPGSWQVDSGKIAIGIESFEGMKAYVFGVFSKPGRLVRQNSGINQPRTFLEWAGEDTLVEFKYGVSFISADQARMNLMHEIPGWDFGKLKSDARSLWNSTLGRIQIEGGSESQKRTFYTALYRCYERMVDITEDKQYYSNYDKKIHQADRPFYVDDWTWDTYLALHPLRTILQPEVESDMIASYIRMYEQSGWLPTFPVLWGDTPCMNGFHSTIMIADACRKGIRNYDSQKAWEAMKKNALQATMIPWRNGPSTSLDTFYYNHGYFPALKPHEKETEKKVDAFEKRQAVAVTLGHSYDDWALAIMSKELGYVKDYDFFLTRSKNYRNLWHPEKEFFLPKDREGQWIPIDPKFDGGMGGRDYYDENNGWTYLWQVQHDIPGLMKLMGGPRKFEERLDQFFREDLGRSKYENWAKFPDFTGIVGEFSMGNEPSFHIPYLYNFAGAPWKTQQRIRMLLDTFFPDNVFGIPGDEDGGGMSAFIVFSGMGFYPVIPGVPIYTIGSPLFRKTSIDLPQGKKFIILAPGCSDTNIYIQEAFLNDKPLPGPWFMHSDLMNGGTLKLVMGPKPNKHWGTNPAGISVETTFQAP